MNDWTYTEKELWVFNDSSNNHEPRGGSKSKSLETTMTGFNVSSMFSKLRKNSEEKGAKEAQIEMARDSSRRLTIACKDQAEAETRTKESTH